MLRAVYFRLGAPDVHNCIIIIIICCVDCQGKTYGQDCKDLCGQCKGGQPCDTVTGECTGGCEPGYTGQNCQHGMFAAACFCLFIYIENRYKLARLPQAELWRTVGVIRQLLFLQANSD